MLRVAVMVLLLVVAGCGGDSPAVPRGSDATTAAEFEQAEIGMSMDEVRTILGEPTRTASIETATEKAVVWDYLAEDGTYYRLIFDERERLGLKLSGQQ